MIVVVYYESRKRELKIEKRRSVSRLISRGKKKVSMQIFSAAGCFLLVVRTRRTYELCVIFSFVIR
jgi:hypothetical protein